MDQRDGLTRRSAANRARWAEANKRLDAMEQPTIAARLTSLEAALERREIWLTEESAANQQLRAELAQARDEIARYRALYGPLA